MLTARCCRRRPTGCRAACLARVFVVQRDPGRWVDHQTRNGSGRFRYPRRPCSSRRRQSHAVAGGYRCGTCFGTLPRCKSAGQRICHHRATAAGLSAGGRRGVISGTKQYRRSGRVLGGPYQTGALTTVRVQADAPHRSGKVRSPRLGTVERPETCWLLGCNTAMPGAAGSRSSLNGHPSVRWGALPVPRRRTHNMTWPSVRCPVAEPSLPLALDCPEALNSGPSRLDAAADRHPQQPGDAKCLSLNSPPRRCNFRPGVAGGRDRASVTVWSASGWVEDTDDLDCRYRSGVELTRRLLPACSACPAAASAPLCLRCSSRSLTWRRSSSGW